jgi:catechol 1,2-dioxygenase
VTTHVFDSIDPYLKSDAVFGVKDSLIVDFQEHAARDTAAEQFGMTPPFVTAEFDFVLKRRA